MLVFLNSLNNAQQGRLEQSDIEFAKDKLAQGLRTVVKEVLDANGSIINPNELENAQKPANLMVPDNQTIFCFSLSRDSRKRVFCIIFNQKPDGSIDRMQQAKIWQAE